MLIVRSSPLTHISKDANQMKIIHLIATKAALLLVYSANNNLYSYQIFLKDGSLYHPQELYSYSFTALKVAEQRLMQIIASQR